MIRLKRLLLEDLPDLATADATPLKGNKKCSWDYNTQEIKVFFDITPIKKMTQIGSKSFSIAGAIISKASEIQNNVLTPVNHVGFVLNNGEVIHATPDKGVVQEKYSDIIDNPEHYICLSVKGSESDLIQKFEQLKKAAGDKLSYDSEGIARKIPMIGTILNRLGWAKENTTYKFFCSELVANLLVRCKVLKYEELPGVSEKTTGLDQYDEIDPTQLYNLIKSKATLLKTICS